MLALFRHGFMLQEPDDRHLLFVSSGSIQHIDAEGVAFPHRASYANHLEENSCRRAVRATLPDVQAGFRKGRGTRNHITNICWIIEKARGFQKNIYFCFIDYAKAFECVDHNKLETPKRDGIPDLLTCLLRNLYAGQEATVKTGHGITD